MKRNIFNAPAVGDKVIYFWPGRRPTAATIARVMARAVEVEINGTLLRFSRHDGWETSGQWSYIRPAAREAQA